jgi:hypothetical protein
VCYEELCAQPGRALETIADRIDVNHRDAFLAQASRLRLAKPGPVDQNGTEAHLVDRCKEVYAELRSRALLT